MLAYQFQPVRPYVILPPDMEEAEPMDYGERAAVALETGFPRHFTYMPGGGEAVSSRSGFHVVVVSTMCVGTFPQSVEPIADHGLVSECAECHQLFVWTDRTQSWTAT